MNIDVQRWSTIGLAALALLAVSVLATPASAQSTRQNTMPVLEQNVDADGAIRVAQQGPVDVTVVGGPTEMPWQQAFTLSFSDDDDASTSFQVPADARLRIELVTWHDNNLSQSVNQFQVVTTVNGATVLHRLPSTAQASNAHMVSESLVLYADPGSTVTLGVEMDTHVGSPNVTQFTQGSLSGVLIPVD